MNTELEAIQAQHPGADVAINATRLIPRHGWLVEYETWTEGFAPQCYVAFVAFAASLTEGRQGGVIVKWHMFTHAKPRADVAGTLDVVLGATENVGSCEPSPRIDWDKTGSTWHTDTKAGRYSIRRLGKRQPFGAFFNNARIGGIPESTSLDVVKRDVERRIIEAKRIAAMTETTPFQSPTGAGDRAH